MATVVARTGIWELQMAPLRPAPLRCLPKRWIVNAPSHGSALCRLARYERHAKGVGRGGGERKRRVRIATFNVNGVNGRLSVLQRWLSEAAPDVVCLQELKAPQDKFPERAIREAGYGAVWYGQKSWNGVAILARGADPAESRRDLPGEPDDAQSRYIEAAVQRRPYLLSLSAKRESCARPKV